MKRILVILLFAVCMSACLGTHYFEPEVVGASDSEERISYLGDTCWFQVKFSHVMTRFQPGEDFKPFKYIVEIEGLEAAEPVMVEHDRDLADLTCRLEEQFPEFYEEWYKEYGSQPKYSNGVIAFEVPANMSEAERKVEVKASIADDYHDTENWGEWFTVFEGTQAGRVYPEVIMPSHILEKSQADIFEPVRINMHKCDEANSLWWYKSKGICDSLVWSIRGFEDTKVIMEDGYELIYFGHLFTHPGELESVLSAYKDGKVVYEDVQNITITNKKDFLMFDWEDIVSGTAEGGMYHNAFDEDRWFSSGVSCEDGNPVVIFNWNNWEDDSEEENRRVLREYISHIYGEPAYTEKSEVESEWVELFVRRDDRYRPECIWMTETSAVALFYVYNEFTETGDWKIIAEPLRD